MFHFADRLSLGRMALSSVDVAEVEEEPHVDLAREEELQSEGVPRLEVPLRQGSQESPRLPD